MAETTTEKPPVIIYKDETGRYMVPGHLPSKRNMILRGLSDAAMWLIMPLLIAVKTMVLPILIFAFSNLSLVGTAFGVPNTIAGVGAVLLTVGVPAGFCFFCIAMSAANTKRDLKEAGWDASRYGMFVLAGMVPSILSRRPYKVIPREKAAELEAHPGDSVVLDRIYF